MDNLDDLEIERAEALGSLLGIVDMVIMAKDIPDFFTIADQIEILRLRRKDYDAADKAYRDARLARLG